MRDRIYILVKIVCLYMPKLLQTFIVPKHQIYYTIHLIRAILLVAPFIGAPLRSRWCGLNILNCLIKFMHFSLCYWFPNSSIGHEDIVQIPTKQPSMLHISPKCQLLTPQFHSLSQQILDIDRVITVENLLLISSTFQ